MPDIDTPDLLPPEEGAASDLHRALSISQSRVLDVDMDVIRRSVLAHTTPASLLPWLAWDRSVDEYVDTWPEDAKRQVVAGSFAYHRVKGTPAALKRALGQLDYATEVTEWFQYGGLPYRFRVAFELPENGHQTLAELRSLFRLIVQAKNTRSYLDAFAVRSQMRAPAPHIAAFGPRRTRTVTLYPEAA